MEETKRGRGFAGLSPEERRERAAEGGRAAHAQGKAPRWTVEQAREVGRKGGLASAAKRRATVSP